MLCTRMQLTERRFRIKSSITCLNSDGNYESTATVTSAPFVRPCTILRMFDGNNVNEGKESIISCRSTSTTNSKSDVNKSVGGLNNVNHKQDIHGSQTNLDRPDDDADGSQKRLNGCTQSSYRAPLIVVTLYLPSEAKTLVPIEIKRDIRRPPSFCQKFQRNSTSKQCKCKINAKPDLMLRGKEITETSSNLCSSPPPNQDNDEILRNDDKTSDECIACSACIMEIERRTPSLTPCVDEAALDLSFDKYHMDSYGNLNKNLEISSSDDIDNESLECLISIKSRPCSPDPSPIIRVTLNNKSSIDINKAISDVDRIVNPNTAKL